ncbi:hypothetical protein CASFOL_013132 [Castilleja foliolosa]|uniref:Uncharacterized protein n=1 Tax=Castilleja foliolosa TaxID=1961234 RepID=A0ABD3DMB6_9LAMI
MNQITKTSKTTTCIFFFLISFSIILPFVERIADSSSAYYYVSFLPLLVAFILVVLIVFTVRTTVVVWITVLVLLAFVGKRRKVLVEEGSKITSDIAFYVVKVVVKEKGLVAFGCATIISATMMAWLRMSDQNYL